MIGIELTYVGVGFRVKKAETSKLIFEEIIFFNFLLISCLNMEISRLLQLLSANEATQNITIND